MNIYDITLTNANALTITKACRLADSLQESIAKGGTHVQGILMQHKGVSITIETPVLIDDLFTILMDNQKMLGYVDFKIEHVRR